MRCQISFLKVLFVGLIALCFCGTARAEELRYKSWLDDNNVIHRFDNQTGDIEKLVKTPSGPPMWVKCEVIQARPAPKLVQTQTQTIQFPTVARTPAVSQPQAASLVEPMTMASIAETAPKKPSAGRIEFWDDKGNNITDEINDADRAACHALLGSYKDKLSLSSTIKSGGDRIRGNISIANNGERRIKLLELTLEARMVGKDKPVELTHILFADKPGCEKPPMPGEGARPIAVLKSIDLPTPSGAINGMPEAKITYIKFED